MAAAAVAGAACASAPGAEDGGYGEVHGRTEPCRVAVYAGTDRRVQTRDLTAFCHRLGKGLGFPAQADFPDPPFGWTVRRPARASRGGSGRVGRTGDAKKTSTTQRTAGVRRNGAKTDRLGCQTDRSSVAANRDLAQTTARRGSVRAVVILVA